jgi:hypothetical protein
MNGREADGRSAAPSGGAPAAELFSLFGASVGFRILLNQLPRNLNSPRPRSHLAPGIQDAHDILLGRYRLAAPGAIQWQSRSVVWP